MDTIQKTVKEIKELKTRGATNIALASLKALKKDFQEEKYEQAKTLKDKIEKLKTSRPTEPLLFNCLDYVSFQVEELSGLNHLNQIIDNLIKKLKEIQEKIGLNGASLIQEGDRILTHCHATTVIEIFKKAKQKGISFSCYLTETRPAFQGRITAEELTSLGIKATMIVDSEAPFLISREDARDLDFVILGSDAINLDGSALNKVGSYGISLAAKEAKIPLFIAATLLKATLKPLPIEERSGEEIWPKKPRRLKIINPAFDLISEGNISKFITEFGFVKPEEIAQLVSQNYPFIMQR